VRGSSTAGQRVLRMHFGIGMNAEESRVLARVSTIWPSEVASEIPCSQKNVPCSAQIISLFVV
jgi:hypothetical protein